MSLESLANELLLDLFEFFTSAHLLRAFLGLNSRFNALLLNHFEAHGLNFQSVSKCDFDTICRQYLPSIVDRITSICLSENENTPQQIDRFYVHGFTLRQFTNLQSLSLYHIHSQLTMSKVMLDFAHLSELTHLTFEHCYIPHDQSYYLSFVNNIWSLPKLTHCCLNIQFENRLFFPSPTMISSTLEYLSISGAEPCLSHIGCLLEHTPRLRHFSTYFRLISVFEHQLPVVTSIITLNISFFSIWYDMVANFFHWMPYLCDLKVDLENNYIDGQKWEDIIRIHLSKVKRLRFRMKFYSKRHTNNDEEQIDEVLDSFRSQFWLDECRWFVRCDWNPNRRDAYIYTLPYAFPDYEFVFPILSKSTCPSNNDQCAYDYVRRFTYKPGLNKCLPESDMAFFNIQDLSLELPVSDHFWSMILKFDQLTSLTLSSNDHSENIRTQLQTLLDSAPRLFSLTFNGFGWLTSQISSFEYRSTSVSQLNFDCHNQYYSHQQCVTLSRSPLGIQCEVLSIDLEHRTCVLDLVDTMINLRALNVRCQDDKWNEQSTATEDELVNWLHHRLPSTCTLTRNSNWDGAIRLWIR